MIRVLLTTALLVTLAPTAQAAPPEVPGQISYQGVLLDTLGEPRTGNVDLTLRIFDAPSAGTLVYKQVFAAVPLSAGVFTVRLGPAGAPTDTPANPLTTSLTDALGGDAGPTAPGRFLEVTVGLEGALARTQILTAPYALRAAAADTAVVAEVAAVADNVTEVNGLDAAVLNQLFQFGNSDLNGPPNADPSEGTADLDGDGRMNFIDDDNDGDSINDQRELSDGSNMNLVTPTLSGVEPDPVFLFDPATVTLGGLHFDPGMTVFLDGDPIASSGVTATSATIQPASGHPAGSVPIFVELPNGQRSLEETLTFSATPPPGVALGGTAGGTVSVSVRGLSQVAISSDFAYAVDTGGGGITDVSVSFNQMLNPGGFTPSQIAVAWAPDGRLVGLRCHPNASGCQVQVIRDADGDHLLEAAEDEVLLGPSYTGTTLRLWGPALAFDASGNVVAAYTMTENVANARPTVLHDRNGNGAFSAGAPERVQIETIAQASGNFGSLAIDPDGQVAYAYGLGLGGGVAAGFRVAWDRNGDGDYADVVGGTPETFTAFSTGGATQLRPCGGIAFEPSGRLAALFAEASASSLRYFRDMNDDGDLVDVEDTQVILGTPTSNCAIHGHPTTGIATAFPTLNVDRNADGDFDDATEATGVSVSGARVGVAFGSGGRAWIGGSGGALNIDPH